MREAILKAEGIRLRMCLQPFFYSASARSRAVKVISA
jgi:hypothetical protein